MESLHGGVLDGSVHQFGLTIGPWMIRPGELVFDAMGPANSLVAEKGNCPGWATAIVSDRFSWTA